MEKYKFSYEDKDIEFEIIRKNVKNINLRVKKDMSVVVSANKKVPLEHIFEFVRIKSKWIIMNLEYFSKFERSREKLYKDFEKFKYLGKKYDLKIEKAIQKEFVFFDNKKIYIFVKNTDDYKKKKSLIDSWYLKQAKKEFANSLDRIYPSFEKYGIAKPYMKIRQMKSRWGSCMVYGQSITLNKELIKSPKECIDYVVLHELVHFLHKNHGKDFYLCMSKFMPDWKDRKEILNKNFSGEL